MKGRISRFNIFAFIIFALFAGEPFALARIDHSGSGGGGSGSITSITAGLGLGTTTGTCGGSITTTGTISNCVATSAKTANYTIVNADGGTLVTYNSASAGTFSLPQATASGNFANGWCINFANLSTGALTISPSTSTISGTPTVLYQNGWSSICSNGTNYNGQGNVGSGPLTPTTVTASKAITAGVQAITVSAAAFATDASLGNTFRGTPTNSTSTAMSAPTNPTDGQVITYELVQNSTGSGTITWNAIFNFGASSAPTLTTTANARDMVSFKYSSDKVKWLYLGSMLGF